MKKELTNYQLNEIKVGEAVTLTTIMAVLAIAVVAVVVFRLFKSNSGSTSIPGGWKFEWK